MILSDEDIYQARFVGAESHRLLIEPWDDDSLQPASYDLHLDREYLKFKEPYTIDIKKPVDELMYRTEMTDRLLLMSGMFVLVQTVERVRLPTDLVGRVEGRSSLGRLGIMVHITAGYIDPGFDGQITLEIANLSNNTVILYPGMRIAQLSLSMLSSPAQVPYGSTNLASSSKYQEQRGVTPSRIWRDFVPKPTLS